MVHTAVSHHQCQDDLSPNETRLEKTQRVCKEFSFFVLVVNNLLTDLLSLWEHRSIVSTPSTFQEISHSFYT